MNEAAKRQSEFDPADVASGDLDALHLGRPDPALRQRTLRSVREALAQTPKPASRWHVWRLEATLAGAIAACFLLLPILDRPPAELRSPPAASPLPDSSETALELLDLDPLEPYVRLRLALAQRNPDPEPRYPTHDFTSRTLDVY